MRAECCTKCIAPRSVSPSSRAPTEPADLTKPLRSARAHSRGLEPTWGHAGPHLRIGKRPLPLASWSSLLHLGISARTFRQAGAMLSPCARSSRHHAPVAIAEVRPRTLKRATSTTVLTSRLRRLHSSVCRPGSRYPLLQTQRWMPRAPSAAGSMPRDPPRCPLQNPSAN